MLYGFDFQFRAIFCICFVYAIRQLCIRFAIPFCNHYFDSLPFFAVVIPRPHRYRRGYTKNKFSYSIYRTLKQRKQSYETFNCIRFNDPDTFCFYIL